MELSEISIWLKETIIGVIILGAMGSALCIGVFKFLSNLFFRWLPNGFKNYRLKRYNDGYYMGQMMSYFHITGHTTGIVSVIVIKAVTILSCFIGATSLQLLFFILFIEGGKVLTIGSYFILLIAMSLMFYSARKFSDLRVISEMIFEEVEEKLSKTVVDETDDRTEVPSD